MRLTVRNPSPPTAARIITGGQGLEAQPWDGRGSCRMGLLYHPGAGMDGALKRAKPPRDDRKLGSEPQKREQGTGSMAPAVLTN